MKIGYLFVFGILTILFLNFVVASNEITNVVVSNSAEDRVGAWGMFSAGKGNPVSSNWSNDWRWDVNVRFDGEKTIKSISISNNRPVYQRVDGEAWTTSSKILGFGKTLYPLVVDYNGNQLNNAYDSSLGTYSAGEHSFVLYGQKESSQFYGGVLLVKFSDGSSMQANVYSNLSDMSSSYENPFEELGVFNSSVSAELSAQYLGIEGDYAGGFGGFGTGGTYSGNSDFHFRAILNLDESKSIAGVNLFHEVPGQIWSSLEGNLYPVVVFYNGTQLNERYAQSLGNYPSGSYTFDLYVQKESDSFQGGELNFIFDDGTKVSYLIGADVNNISTRRTLVNHSVQNVSSDRENVSTTPGNITSVNNVTLNNGSAILGITPTICSGCIFDENCYPFGYRKNMSYCSDNNLSFVSQKNSDDLCDNSFECGSNVCVSGKCISSSLMDRIISWFSGLFG
ncbi:MAG: hypothetical protein AABX11_00055 [Nanoarchaeota archaeon]